MGNLLTVAAAAVRLAVSDKTVYRWYWNGDLAGVKIGRCVRIYEDSLNDFLESHSNGKPATTLDATPTPDRARSATAAIPRRSKATAGTPMVFRFLPPERHAA